jgi:hypothetical protein
MKAFRNWMLGTAACLSTAIALPAAAQERRIDTVTVTGPDRGLLYSGVWTLGLTYAPAAIVGVTSSLPADRYLLAPVAGPWVDLGKRNCTRCEHEDVNKVLLAADGILQSVGALELVGSFLFVEKRTTSLPATASDDKPSVRFVPSRVGRGYGLAAVGHF